MPRRRDKRHSRAHPRDGMKLQQTIVVGSHGCSLQAGRRLQSGGGAVRARSYGWPWKHAAPPGQKFTSDIYPATSTVPRSWKIQPVPTCATPLREEVVRLQRTIKGKKSTHSPHFQHIAHRGACGKTLVVAQNGRPRPKTCGNGSREVRVLLDERPLPAELVACWTRGRRQAERCSSWLPGSSRLSGRPCCVRWLPATSDRS